MSFITLPWAFWIAGTNDIPATRGRARPQGLESYERHRLDTDSIGTTIVTLTNVVVGSRYRIEVAGTGALAEPTANAEGVAASSTVPITLNLYAAGNANNDLRIKVRKGTSPTKYQPFETQVTLAAQAQSAYIAQIPDPIA